MVEAILPVRVDKILALTPEPNPSDKTAIKDSGARKIVTLSPHSSSPVLMRLAVSTSTKKLKVEPSLSSDNPHQLI